MIEPKDSVPVYDLYLYLTNSKKLLTNMGELVKEWVEVHRNEDLLDIRLKNIVRLGAIDYSQEYDCRELLKEWLISNTFFESYTLTMKDLLINRQYREMGKIQQVYDTRVFELSSDKNTLAIFYPKRVRPNTVIIYRKVHEESYIEACQVVNLDDLDYSLGVYGIKAKQTFIDRVAVYID